MQVEANDTVAITTISKPKPLPDKVLIDMAFSAATKLQCLRHLVQYFKQSAKMIEQQFQKEARFYVSLIRLQNWKVKRQRGNAPGSNNFMFDVVDTTQHPCPVCHHCIWFQLIKTRRRRGKLRLQTKGVSSNTSSAAEDDVSVNDDGNKSVKQAHSILRNIHNHKSIFEEQVFDMVIRETFVQTQGVNVTGMREDFLQLAIGPESLFCLSLVNSGQDSDSEVVGHEEHTNSEANLVLAMTNGSLWKATPRGFLTRKVWIFTCYICSMRTSLGKPGTNIVILFATRVPLRPQSLQVMSVAR